MPSLNGWTTLTRTSASQGPWMTQQPFLDLLIHLEGGKLRTTTYKKPTDRNSLLSFRSHHPKALRENLPYGQFIRIRRNCTTTQDYEEQATDLEEDLQERDYPKEVVRKARKRAKNNNRQALLETKAREDTDMITCVTTYTPLSNKLKKVINRNWRILNSEGETWFCQVQCVKRTANIRDCLVHTRPRPRQNKSQTPLWNLPSVTGHHPCGNCLACSTTTD